MLPCIVCLANTALRMGSMFVEVIAMQVGYERNRNIGPCCTCDWVMVIAGSAVWRVVREHPIIVCCIVKL